MIHLQKKGETICILLPPFPRGPGMIKSPPMDIANLISVLKQEGFLNIRLVDFRKHIISEDGFWENQGIDVSIFSDIKKCFEYLTQGGNKKIEKTVQRILLAGDFRKIDYLVCSVSVLEQSSFVYMLTALCLIKELKRIKPDIKIILFGSCPEKHAKVVMEQFSFVDAFVEDANEYSVKNYIIENKKQVPIEGVYFRSQGKVISSSGKTPLYLDHMPMADYSLFDLKAYTYKGQLVLPYELSRGCEKNCFFCYYIRRNSLENRAIAKIVADLKKYAAKYQTNIFHFMDAAINFEESYLRELCGALKAQLPGFKWSALARPNFSYDMLKAMKEAGCVQIRWGVESGSDRMLKLINKGTTVKSIETTLKFAHELGIYNFITVLTGLKNETEEDINATKEFIERNRFYIDSIHECLYGELGYFNVEDLRKMVRGEKDQGQGGIRRYGEVLKKYKIPTEDIVDMLSRQKVATILIAPGDDFLSVSRKIYLEEENALIERMKETFKKDLCLENSCESYDVEQLIKRNKTILEYFSKLRSKSSEAFSQKLSKFIMMNISCSDCYILYLSDQRDNFQMSIKLAKTIKSIYPTSEILFYYSEKKDDKEKKLMLDEAVNGILLRNEKDFQEVFINKVLGNT